MNDIDMVSYCGLVYLYSNSNSNSMVKYEIVTCGRVSHGVCYVCSDIVVIVIVLVVVVVSVYVYRVGPCQCPAPLPPLTLSLSDTTHGVAIRSHLS